MVPEFQTDRYRGLARMTWSNASFLAPWRYRYNTGRLETLYERLGQDLRKLVETVSLWRDQGLDPREAMQPELPSSGEATK